MVGAGALIVKQFHAVLLLFALILLYQGNCCNVWHCACVRMCTCTCVVDGVAFSPWKAAPPRNLLSHVLPTLMHCKMVLVFQL